jgi:hypothetical protein
MNTLQDLLGSEQGDQAVNEISQNVGAESSLVNTAVQMALPALINGLANNASTPEGAEKLNNALEEHHDGSILDNIGGLAGMIFGGGQSEPPPQADAGGILGHILGGSQGQVAQDVSQKTGLGMGQVAQILMFLAPIVMGYLGRQKQQQGVGADGLGGLLGGLLGNAQSQTAPSGSGGGSGGIINSVLDRDHDGSSMDDIASMAFDYIRNK